MGSPRSSANCVVSSQLNQLLPRRAAKTSAKGSRPRMGSKSCTSNTNINHKVRAWVKILHISWVEDHQRHYLTGKKITQNPEDHTVTNLDAAPSFPSRKGTACMSIYIYIYTCVCVCMYVCMYVWTSALSQIIPNHPP